jgi:hypothetical protein
MKRIGLIILSLSIGFSLFAQKAKQKVTFTVTAESALLNGDNHVNAQILLIGGYEIYGWSVGVGSGFDYYKYRTVPVVLDLKKYFGKGNRQFFAYANGGADIAWPTEKQKNLHKNVWWNFNSNNQFKNGYYSDLGLGYTLFNGKRRGFYTALGYSIKTLTETYNEEIWTGTTSVISKRTLEYKMNRIVLKVGYRF